MADEELLHWIEDKIVAGISHDDIIMQVAEHAGVSWQDAAMLVEDVYQQRQGQINRRQGPLMLAICLGVIAAGIFMAYTLIMRIIDAGSIDDYGYSMMNVLANAPALVFALGVALAAVAGGVGGLVRTINGMMRE